MIGDKIGVFPASFVKVRVCTHPMVSVGIRVPLTREGGLFVTLHLRYGISIFNLVHL